MRCVVWGMIVLGWFGCSAAVAEEDKPERSPEGIFKRLDTNADGKLTLEEFTARRANEDLDKAKARFAKVDKNRDGFIDLDEFKALLARRKSRSLDC